MRKINDSKLYLFFGLTVLLIGTILSIFSFYSYKIIQPKVIMLLNAKDNLDQNYKSAYLMLRKPQVFALYENFDSSRDIDRKYETAVVRKLEDPKKLEQLKDDTYPGSSVKDSIVYLDAKIMAGQELVPLDLRNLNALLDRRMKGAKLGRNTAVFCLLLAVISFAVFFYERKVNLKVS